MRRTDSAKPQRVPLFWEEPRGDFLAQASLQEVKLDQEEGCPVPNGKPGVGVIPKKIVSFHNPVPETQNSTFHSI